MEKVFLSRARSSRRQFLGGAGAATLALASTPGLAETTVKLPLPGGPDERPITTAFPQKGALILQRTRPPLLETPMDVFDQSVFTPNDRFYVRWHWAIIPTEVNVDTFRLAVHGHVNQALSLSLGDVLALPRVELVAVNQCSGNSRGYFEPRVSGGQWSHGAMGNARWVGVRVKDVLDRAGIKAGAVQVRFNGMEEPAVPDAPDFMKSLDIDHARDGEVMLAYAMNGEQLPVAQRLSPPPHRPRLVLHLLGQDAQRHRSAGATRHEFLDEDGLHDPGHAAREHQARGNRRQNGADHPNGSAVLHHKYQVGRYAAGW